MKTQLFLCATGERFPAMAKAAAKRWRSLLPELAGVTIAGDADAILCGLGHYDPARRACALKLHAWELVEEDVDAILYADLDVYPSDPMPPSMALANVDFACARDRWDDAEVSRVAESVGVPPHQYFNAGLFYARRAAAPMMELSRPLFDRLKWWDQTAFNVARFASRTPTAWLPWRQNAMDRHKDGYAMANSHCPDHAWSAWENKENHAFTPLPQSAHVISSMDLSHHWSTDGNHLMALAILAQDRRHVLDVGTFMGHSALAMASAGALVTSLDPANQTRRVWDPLFGLTYDAIQTTGQEWLTRDPDGVYDVIFHDAEHGPEIIPELQQWWTRILPGGALAIHDAEQLEGWRGESLSQELCGVSTSFDARGRELLILHKF